MAYRRTFRERKFQIGQDERSQRPKREFNPETFAQDLQPRFDAVFRGKPAWELELIFHFGGWHEPFTIEDDQLPGWIELELVTTRGELIELKLKRITKKFELSMICEYPPGAVNVLNRRRYLQVKIKFPDGTDTVIGCKFGRWR